MDPYEASRGFHEDIERTKDRRRIRPVDAFEIFDGRFRPCTKKEESPSKIESFIWKIGSLRS